MTMAPHTVAAGQRWARNIAWLAAALWTGSLWGVGFLSVPVLFSTLSDKMLAGMLAGKMFTLVAWVGIGAAVYFLSWLAAGRGKQAWRQPAFLIAAAMLVLTLLGEFGLQPQMAALKAQALPGDVMHSAHAAAFQTLHGIARAMYLAQCLLGLALVLKARDC